MKLSFFVGILVCSGCVVTDGPSEGSLPGLSPDAERTFETAFGPGAADPPRNETDLPPDDLGQSDVAVLTSSDHPDCEAPVGPDGAFRDGLADSGVSFVHSPFPPPEGGGVDDVLTARFHVGGIAGGGVSVADLDGDGRPDLIFAQTVGPNAVYWGREGGFEAATGTGLELPNDLTTGVSTADYNGDGLPDVALFGMDLFRLFRNEGDGTFTDRTNARGLDAASGWSSGASWADIDNDGDLDLLAAGYAITVHSEGIPLQAADTRLWRNDHTRFTEITDSLPAEAVGGAALLASFRDFDADGDSDLLIAHDFGTMTNTVLLDNAGIVGGAPHWIDRFDTSGAGVLRAPMGGALRDLNGDGLIDLWFSGLGGVRPLRATDPFEFLDASLSWGLDVDSRIGDVSWSVAAVDLGGYGRPGLYFAYGPLPEVYRNPETEIPSQPDRWMRVRTEGGALAFEEFPDALPVGPDGDSRGLAIGDLDRNGVPDLVVGRIGEAPAILMGQCNAAHRLVVELDDSRRADRRGVGAVITVRAGGTRLSQTIDAGGLGTYSGSEAIAFFGLGARTEVDGLTIEWPDGSEDTFEDVCSHCRVRVSRDSD